MDQILNQLGELVLGAVPTMILFILLVIAYGFLVRRPLDHVLAERHARTLGAIEQAKGSIAKAESETTAYEEKLRNARASIAEARAQKLKQWNAYRETALAQVRQHTQDRVKGARQEIEQSPHDARLHIVAASEDLSERVLKAVLPAGVTTTEEVAQ